MSNRSTLLLEHHLKELRLPTFLREYRKLAAQCAAENVDHPDYLLRLAELELIDRHQRMVERRIRAARFPAVKSLDTFDFLAIPSVNKALVMELARCEYIEHRENVIAVGNSGTGKTYIALGLGLAACQRECPWASPPPRPWSTSSWRPGTTAACSPCSGNWPRLRLLIIDELGFVPRSTTGAELLFEVFSQRYERGSVLVTTNLPFDEWTDVFGSETAHRSPAGPPHPPRPYPGDERRQLPAQGQPAGRRSPVSRLPRRPLAPTRTAPPYPRSLPAAGRFP